MACYKLKGKGLTLMELLVTLSLVMLLVTLSAPGHSDLMQKQHAKATVMQLRKAVTMAKTQAITNNTFTTLCRSADGIACNGKWEQGVLMFLDTDGDRKLDKEHTKIAYLRFPKFYGQIYWRAFQNRQYLQLIPSGATRYQNGSFTICPQDGDLSAAQQIIVNRVGRVRYAEDRDGDGLREGSNGKPLRC